MRDAGGARDFHAAQLHKSPFFPTLLLNRLRMCYLADGPSHPLPTSWGDPTRETEVLGLEANWMVLVALTLDTAQAAMIMPAIPLRWRSGLKRTV